MTLLGLGMTSLRGACKKQVPEISLSRLVERSHKRCDAWGDGAYIR